MKLDLGNLEANPPKGANPFQTLTDEGDTAHLDPIPDPEHGGVEEVGPPPLTPATYPSWMLTEGTPSISPEPVQSICQGLIGQVAALELGTHV